jgi:tetratricopeptide (TPR) repeat protein/transcriptional regulator with XRE-family HTH domain
LAKPAPSALGLALTYLRSAAGWTRARLGHAVGHKNESAVSQYERGSKPLSRERLERLLAPLGQPPEAVDVLLFAHGLIFPEPPATSEASPVPLSPEELRLIDRAAMASGWSAAEHVRAEAIRWRKREKADAAKQGAEEAFQRLLALPPEERRRLLFAGSWSWALALRFSEGSLRKAAHRPEEALELADLALSIAERSAGPESWRSRLTGFCWAHVANARRVANDHAGADEAFARAWDLWRAGADADGLLPEWRLFDLEASLRRAERRFPEALELLDWARAGCGGDPLAVGRILLKKERAFNQMGDVEAALAALTEAAPFIEASGDRRLLFALRFNMADDLCHLRRFAEAAALLPQVREMAVQQSNELDLLRVMWLTSKTDAGQGRMEEALAGLEQVCEQFMVYELPYEAALASLDLAVLYLEAGRTAEVKDLAVASGRVFRMNGIDREALASFSLFCDAARQEIATLELVRRVRAEIEEIRRSASSSETRRGRG